MSVDIKAAERAIFDFLRALGHDPQSQPELAETPTRVVEAFANDLLCGYDIDVRSLLDAGSETAQVSSEQLVVVRDLAVTTTCPHHLMPAYGKATVGYIPGRRLLGFGTIGALVDAFARRLTLQETIAERVAHSLVHEAGARGAFCELRLMHGCLNARAVRHADASVQTLATAGCLSQPSAAATLSLALGTREREP
jgi:GTP cyclohydrolase I